MIRLVIANTHHEARRYCIEHDLDRRTMTVTPACSSSLRGISLRPEEVVNVCRIGPGMSDADYQRYLWLMEDVEAALRRGDR